MIKTNLTVSLDSADGSEEDVLSVKTTAGTHVIVETGGIPKVAVNPSDLNEALETIKQFLANRPKHKKQTASLQPEIIYGDDEASNS